MPDHFTLDVDPAGLRHVATKIGHLREHLRQKGTAARQVPDEIGDRWTGDAATQVKTEMTGIGNLMHTLDGHLEGLPAAMQALATTYDEALAQLPGLNRRWQQANDDYDTAVTRADSDREQARSEPEPDQTDIGRAHENALTQAADNRRKELHDLEYSFGMMKLYLRQETAKLSTTMLETAPIGVTDQQIREWYVGQNPTLDTAAIVGGLGLMGQRLDLLREQELQAERDAKREEAQSDVDDLQEALDDNDPEAVNDALEAIGERSDDDIYSEQLVELLGPGGIQDLYLQIDQGLQDSDLYFEDLWPALEGFNNTVANGISQKPDTEFAEFVEVWMDKDYGPKMWALVAASDLADGRVNAIAMAHHSEVYNAALSDPGGMPGLYPQAFINAYGDADMIEQWDERSTGDDLARVIQASSPEQIEKIMQRMLQVNTDGGTMNEDDFAHIADTYRETVWALQNRYDNAIANDEEINVNPLMELLRMGNFVAGRSPYDDMIGLSGLQEEIARDPDLITKLLEKSRTGEPSPSEIKDLIEGGGVPVEEVIAASLQYRLDQGDSAESAAAIVGHLLRAGDIIDENFNWAVVVESLTKSGISALTDKNPVVGAVAGPVMDLLEGVIGEMQRLEELDKQWDSSAEKSGAQEIIALNLYIQFNGAPEGLEEFLDEQAGSDVSPSDLSIAFIERMRQGQAGTPEEWEQLRLIITTIDETRDEA